MFRLLDKYILKKQLVTFFFVVFILLTIITVIDITEKMEKYVSNNLSLAEVVGYYINFIPFIANLITPLTAFIATVYITSRLAGHTEIIAMLSSGMSFRRMLVPFMIGGLIIASLNIWFTGWVIPTSNRAKLDFEIKYLEKMFIFSERDVHIQTAPDEYTYLRSFNNTTNIGQAFSLEIIKKNELKEKLQARLIQWDDETKKWKLKDWKYWKMEGEKEIVETGVELDTILAITPEDFSNDYRRYDGMTTPQLNEYIELLKVRGASNVEVYEVEKYVRYTSPFTVLILTFMGVIVSSRKSRGGTGFRIALGFMLSFVFILCFILAKSIAEVGDMEPAFAVWIPNIIFGFISLLMYKNVPK
ncbi:MAG: LptF/LptG family permease [Cyclobacteriaceae bacterium]|nr:LptF/LptG family permease [Cyclobacteriaceae bacterium]